MRRKRLRSWRGPQLMAVRREHGPCLFCQSALSLCKSIKYVFIETSVTTACQTGCQKLSGTMVLWHQLLQQQPSIHHIQLLRTGEGEGVKDEPCRLKLSIRRQTNSPLPEAQATSEQHHTHALCLRMGCVGGYTHIVYSVGHA